MAKCNVGLYLRADGVPVARPLFQAEGAGSTPSSALDLTVGRVDMATAVAVNRYWHSRLPRFEPFQERSLEAFAAVYLGGIYAVAIWSRPIAANRLTNGDRMRELRRLAIGPMAPRNTATRMLSLMAKYIKRHHSDVCRLISYQDTEVHTGTIYKAAGWTPVAASHLTDWTVHSSRPGSQNIQTEAVKIRWEKQIRREPPLTDDAADSTTVDYGPAFEQLQVMP